MNLHDCLDGYIPTKTAMAIIVAQGAANVCILYTEMNKQAKRANEIIADQQERLKIFHESTDFLLGRASDSTIVELNKNLDFWRVVRGDSVRPSTTS